MFNQNIEDINYFTFVLGFDLLNDRFPFDFKQSQISRCDIVYDTCHDIATKFVKSEYYKENHGGKLDDYAILCNWLDTNKDTIEGYIRGGEE